MQLEGEIELLEHRLFDLDQADAIDGASTSWRLRIAEYNESWDPAQRDLLKELQEKLLVYGEKYHSLSMQSLILEIINAGSLLFNDQRFRSMDTASKADYRSMLHWVMGNKPLATGQYEWIFQPDDFVQLSSIDHFQSTVLSSFLKVSLSTLNVNYQNLKIFIAIISN